MSNSSKIKSDGGSSSYYDLPPSAVDIGDLIEYRRMSYGVANIFKACFRLGQKDGISDEYDLNKIIYFAQRELEFINGRVQENPREAASAVSA